MFPITPPVVWGNRSFLIEMKPRSKDLVSLFVDCPLPPVTTESFNNIRGVGDAELVKIGNNALEITDESECCSGCDCTGGQSSSLFKRIKFILNILVEGIYLKIDGILRKYSLKPLMCQFEPPFILMAF